MRPCFHKTSICTLVVLTTLVSWAQGSDEVSSSARPELMIAQAQLEETKSAEVKPASAVIVSPSSNTELTAPASPHTVSANAALYSQYIYRGLMQSNAHPAFQLGVDYSHVSGLYLGAWGSTITWIRDSGVYAPNPSANVELDVYGGYKHTLESNKDLSFDLGFLRYNYFGTYPSGAVTPDTNELYASVIWKWLSAKYSYSLGKTFGVDNAKGTGYLDLTAAIPVTDEVTLTLHAGRQQYKGSINGVSNSDMYSYTDYRIELAKNLNANWQIGAGVSDTTAKGVVAGQNAYFYPAIDKSIGKATGYAFVKKTF